MASLLEAAGAQPKNPSRGKAITPALRFETGLFSNRNPLHDVAQWVYSKFYGGYTDTLWDGSNMEISNQLSLIRRPGLAQWSSVTVPDQVNWFYNWRTLDCGVKVVVDTPTSTYLQTATTQQKIFTKSAGAGQGYYQGVGDILYYGDGVDLQYVTINPPNCTITGPFQWGINEPLTSPSITVTESALSAVNWVASTVFSTMGLTYDTNTNTVQQVIGVNADPVDFPNSSTTIGETGSGQPNWNQTPGGFTPDNGFNWTNWGPIVLRTPNTNYSNGSTGGTIANPCFVYDPSTKCVFIQANSNPGLRMSSSAATITFNSSPGSETTDGAVVWFNLGPNMGPWLPSHAYTKHVGSSFDPSNLPFITEPSSLANGIPSGTTTYVQANNTGGTLTSGTAGRPPFASTVKAQDTTSDKQILWLCLGSAATASYTRQSTFNGYIPWSAMGTAFSVIIDPGTNTYQGCVVNADGSATGTTAGSAPTFSAVYGNTTIDGGVTWVCLGGTLVWAANTFWYLPLSGWSPPSASNPFGGAIINDASSGGAGNLQGAISTAVTGASAPSWSTVPGTTTTDNGVVLWKVIGPASASSGGFATTKSVTYAYSYESRLPTDINNTTAQPNLGVGPLGPPTGSESGQISTASPLTTFTGANAGAVYTLTIPRSTNPAVDTIVIWRTLDGGTDLFFVGEINNNGPGPNAMVTDSTPYADLNELVPAPINSANNPPPAGFKPMAYHFERIWGAVGNFVFVSGGGDVITGNPNESFDPEDFFEFPSPVTRIVPTATGILVFLTSDVYAILGGPIFDTFFPTPMVPGIGLLHYNALDIHGGQIFLFSADAQFLSMDPSGGVQRMGGPVADKLQLFNPTKVYVTVHERGNDNAIFISDGSTGWYRVNPQQFPNGSAVWSPFAAITNGAGAVLSIEVTTGDHRLLVAGLGSNKPILYRDYTGTVWTDNGTPYSCFGTIGSFVVAQPGQIAGMTFVNVRAIRTGTTPTVSFLLNEVSGTFITFPEAQAYPWQIYGATGAPTSLYSNAYYFRATGVPALAEHFQVKVAFPAEAYPNEVLSLSLFGVVEQSPED